MTSHRPDPTPIETAGEAVGSAWNPGLAPDLPARYRHLETIFQPANVFSGFEDVAELSRQTGLAVEKLVDFRPERLVLHELIVRVTAGVFIAEGDSEVDLGHNFRRIVRTIWQESVVPQMPALRTAYGDLLERTRLRVGAELDAELFARHRRSETRAPNLLLRWFGRGAKPRSGAGESVDERDHRILAGFADRAASSSATSDAAIYKSLHRIMSALIVTRGYLGRDRDYLLDLVTRHVLNRYGGRVLGGLLQPWIEQAIDKHGYIRINNTDKPVLISLKGASAAGKSSLRPMLNRVIAEQGLDRHSYATISPDIWRRLLLDFDSLGAARKYAGRCTSKEMTVIDSKLDRYIRDQARATGSIPNLLVDRFRFDSFSSEKVSRILHHTYARYVDTMYMYFVITPPEATVERGWLRGLQVGRYKAVEDFLDHSVEAYTGMPRILFKWLAYARPSYRFEFLDNSVTKGAYPKTIAAGTQGFMRIHDPLALIDMERYRKINIKATSPAEVYPDAAHLAVAENIDFLRQCIRRIARVEFVDPENASVYAGFEQGRCRVLDRATFARMIQDPQMAEIFAQLAPELDSSAG